MKTLSRLRARTSIWSAWSLLTLSCGHATPKPKPVDPLAASAAQVSSEVAAPEQGAQQVLGWVLDVINEGGEISPEEVERRFAPEFLSELPTAQVVETFQQVGEQLPPIVLKRQSDVPPSGAVALLETKAGPIRAEIALSETAPRKIAGLVFTRITEPAKSYDEVRALLQKAGEKSSLLVAEVVDGRCKPEQALDDEAQLAIGSTHKLWVLLALDTKLRADKSLSWDSKMVLKDALKSFPSGELQDTPAGTEVSLREAAAKMISISDNTATDHLVDLIGRERVERAQRDSKHAHPEANIPWLTTRELFVMKLSGTEQELAAYRGAPVPGKRKRLAALAGRPLETDAVASWTKPRSLDLEWFASTRDLCNVMATLGARAEFKPESELLKALGENSGVALEADSFKYVGFKGGSEPGVMNLSWLVQRTDGRWFVVALTVNDASKLLDDQAILSAAEGALKLVRD